MSEDKLDYTINDSIFDDYVCGVTGNPCCGCSLFCEHRKEKKEKLTYEKISEMVGGDLVLFVVLLALCIYECVRVLN